MENVSKDETAIAREEIRIGLRVTATGEIKELLVERRAVKKTAARKVKEINDKLATIKSDLVEDLKDI